MIHTVVPGDTLSYIALEYLGSASEWPVIWEDNRATVDNPNLIYPGEQIYVPRHANGRTIVPVTESNYQPNHADPGPVGGTLDCSGLESLWDANGGNPSAAFTAAEIAMAESGGNEFATGAAGERGYWQINPVNGSLSTYDPDGNARAAIELSDNGTNWSPWTTYTSGLYAGRC
jgi:hypothetical protein